MGATVSQDIVYRASFKNDTERGAREVRSELNKLRADSTAAIANMRAESEKNSRILRKNGDFIEAARVERRAGFTAELSDLRRQTTEKIARDRENAGAYRSAASAERRRIAERYRKTEMDEAIKGVNAELDAAEKARAKKEEELAEKSGKGKGKGEGKGHASHWSRLFSDQSTTGMDVMERGLTGALAEKFGWGLKLGVAAVIGKGLADMTGKAAEFADQLHRGKTDAWGVTTAIAEGAPVIGGFVTAGQNLREIWKSEKFEIELANKAAETRLQIGDAYLQQSRETLKTIREQGESLRAMRAAADMIPLRGSQLDLAGIHEQGNQRRFQADEMLREAKQTGSATPAVKQAQAAYDSLVKEYGQRQYDGTLKKFPGLGDEVDAAREELVRLTKQAAKENAANIAYAQNLKAQANTDETKATGEYRIRLNERLNLEGMAAGGEHDRSVAGIRAASQGIAGDVGASRYSELAGALAGEKLAARMKAQQDTNATTDAGERDTIARRLNTKLFDLDQEGAVKRDALHKELEGERLTREHEAGKAEADAVASTNAHRLRTLGEGFAAEKVLRDQAFADHISDLKFKAEMDIRQNRDNEGAIRRQLAADIAKAGNERSENERQAGERNLSERFGIVRDMSRFQLNALQLEARAGNIKAASDAKLLEIAEKYAATRMEISKLIRDPNVTKAEKDLLQQQLDGLGAQEEKERKLSMFAGGGVRLAGLVMSAGGSGRAAAINEQNTSYNRLQAFLGNSASGSSSSADNASRQATQQQAMKTDQMIRLLQEISGKLGPTKSAHPGMHYQHH